MKAPKSERLASRLASAAGVYVCMCMCVCARACVCVYARALDRSILSCHPPPNLPLRLNTVHSGGAVLGIVAHSRYFASRPDGFAEAASAPAPPLQPLPPPHHATFRKNGLPQERQTRLSLETAFLRAHDGMGSRVRATAFLPWEL